MTSTDARSEPETREYPGIDDVSVSLADGVLSVTLNRPDSLNSLTQDMLTAVAEALLERDTLSRVEFEAVMRGETLPPMSSVEQLKPDPSVSGQAQESEKAEQPSAAPATEDTQPFRNPES